MKYVLAALVLLGSLVATPLLFAQGPPPQPSPQAQADRLALELVYMCRTALADLWARGNALEAQVKQLQENVKSLEEKPDASKKK